MECLKKTGGREGGRKEGKKKGRKEGRDLDPLSLNERERKSFQHKLLE
jgi:hypothetical protein